MRGDRGAVTVEAAVAVLALTTVLTFALAGVGAAANQVRCVDAAREAARVAARGDPERARAIAEEIAPAGAVVDITAGPDTTTAECRADAPLLPGVRLRATSVALTEPEGP